MGSAMQTGTFGGLAASAVADDVVNKLPAVHADVHGAPVLRELLGELKFIFGGRVLSVH